MTRDPAINEPVLSEIKATPSFDFMFPSSEFEDEANMLVLQVMTKDVLDAGQRSPCLWPHQW